MFEQHRVQDSKHHLCQGRNRVTECSSSKKFVKRCMARSLRGVSLDRCCGQPKVLFTSGEPKGRG